MEYSGRGRSQEAIITAIMIVIVIVVMIIVGTTGQQHVRQDDTNNCTRL